MANSGIVVINAAYCYGESVGRPGPQFTAGDDLFDCNEGCSPGTLHSISYRRDFCVIRGVDIVSDQSLSLFSVAGQLLLTRAKPLQMQREMIFSTF